MIYNNICKLINIYFGGSCLDLFCSFPKDIEYSELSFNSYLNSNKSLDLNGCYQNKMINYKVIAINVYFNNQNNI